MPFRVNDQNRHLRVLTLVAMLVASVDWLSKAAAARFVASEPLVLGERLHFAALHNDGTAFGLSAGTYTWQLNLALTLAAILLIIPVARDLARIDAAAPSALGLITAGALGNLGSLALGPPGVVDFISIGFGPSVKLVVNFADIAAYIGLAMMLRTGFLIVAEMRRAARPRRTMQVQHWATVAKRTASWVDREVPLPAALAADLRPEMEVVTRTESVRRAEVADVAMTDPKVIDIRPHLRAEGVTSTRMADQRTEGIRGD